MAKFKLPKASLDQELTLREKAFLGVVLVGILLLFVNVLWGPASKRIEAMRASLGTLQAQVDSLQQLIDATKGLVTSHGGQAAEEMKVDPRVQQILDRYVADPSAEIHNVVAALSSGLTSRGLKVEDIKVGLPAERASFTMVPITLRAQVRYGALVNFFSTVERADLPLILRRFTLSRPEKGAAIDMVAELEFYIVKR